MEPMDWRQGLERANAQLGEDKISELLSTTPDFVRRYHAGEGEPTSAEAMKLKEIGPVVVALEDAGWETTEIRKWFDQPHELLGQKPAEAVRGARFTDLRAAVNHDVGQRQGAGALVGGGGGQEAPARTST